MGLQFIKTRSIGSDFPPRVVASKPKNSSTYAKDIGEENFKKLTQLSLGINTRYPPGLTSVLSDQEDISKRPTCKKSALV